MTTGLFTRLIIDVRISDVTTGELQIVSTSLYGLSLFLARTFLSV